MFGIAGEEKLWEGEGELQRRCGHCQRGIVILQVVYLYVGQEIKSKGTPL